MKTIVLSSILGVLLTSSAAFAATGQISGKPTLTVSEAGSVPQYVSIPSGASTGACFHPPAPTAVFRIRDDASGDRMRALILSALLSGRNVTVNWDDTVRDASTYCYVRTVIVQP
jgi:hypothetical protein